MLRILYLLLLITDTAAAGQLVTGKIYDLNDTEHSKPLFLYQRRLQSDGAKETANTVFTFPDGKHAVREEVIYENGKFKKYSYNQLQVNEFGTAEVRDGKIFYSFTAQGKSKEDDEDFDDRFIVSDMIGSLLASRWPEIESGDSVKVRYILVERLETIGFKFFKDKEIIYNGEPAVEITMKPSSFIIAALAPELKLTLQKNSPHRILESSGRLPVRVPEVPDPKTRKDWRAIDAILVFESKAKP